MLVEWQEESGEMSSIGEEMTLSITVQYLDPPIQGDLMGNWFTWAPVRSARGAWVSPLTSLGLCSSPVIGGYCIMVSCSILVLLCRAQILSPLISQRVCVNPHKVPSTRSSRVYHQYVHFCAGIWECWICPRFTSGFSLWSSSTFNSMLM